MWYEKREKTSLASRCSGRAGLEFEEECGNSSNSGCATVGHLGYRLIMLANVKILRNFRSDFRVAHVRRRHQSILYERHEVSITIGFPPLWCGRGILVFHLLLRRAAQNVVRQNTTLSTFLFQKLERCRVYRMLLTQSHKKLTNKTMNKRE